MKPVRMVVGLTVLLCVSLFVHGQQGVATANVTVPPLIQFSNVGADASVVKGARNVSLYAIQSPENWFEDFGSGTLTNGVATVTLDPTFAQTVNATNEYHVFLTPKGESEGLYVSDETPQGFEVHEQRGGRSSVAFDYRIVAKRAGYENRRLGDVTARYQKMREQEERHLERMQQLRAAHAASAPLVPHQAPPQSRIAQESK